MRVERFVEIDAPVEQVFDAFGDFENVPRWMRNVRDVRRTGRRTSRWTADTSSARAPFEWDVETTVYEPDRRIVWRAIGGDVDTDGEMILHETPRGTSLLRLVISYYPTGGQHGPAVARFFGSNAGSQLEEDLERLKRDLECRAGVRRRRRHHDHADADDERIPRRTHRSDEGGDARRASRPHDNDAFIAHRRARDDRHDEIYDERERRFEAALREARRSQLENMRRYDEEREEHARRRRFVDARRPDERERNPRHALTPREREREASERRVDGTYSSELMRRGIDRLLDDAPPSSRWRRRD